MRLKSVHPSQLAIDLLDRSECRVKVTAVLADSHGIFAWGWNSSGRGFGLCAERHCLNRVNRKRLDKATMWVIGIRKSSGNFVNSKPCAECQRALKGVGKVMYWDKTAWVRLWP